MTEAISSPSPSPIFVRCKIASIDRKRNLIRLVVPDVGNDEYILPENADQRFAAGDYVDATILGGQIQDIRYPPGAEPPEPKAALAPSKVQEPPKVSTPSTEVTTSSTTPKEVAPVTPSKKPLPPHILMKGAGFVIISGTPAGEQKFTLIEKALQYIGSFHEGDLVNFSCAGKDKIKNMWKVLENGERPPKKDYQQGSQMAKPCKTVCIGGTINLGNYENLKIEVSGPYESPDDIKQLKDELLFIFSTFGGTEQTHEIITGYCHRVIGGMA